MRETYGMTLARLGEKYTNLVVLDADLSKSTNTAKFAKVYPERFFNMDPVLQVTAPLQPMRVKSETRGLN